MNRGPCRENRFLVFMFQRQRPLHLDRASPLLWKVYRICSKSYLKYFGRMGMKQSSMLGGERVRHSSLNVEGSDFYKKMRAEAKAKEEEEKKKKLGISEEEKEGGEVEEGGGDEGGDGGDVGAEESALNFFEDAAWTPQTLRNNFFEDHHHSWEEGKEEEEVEDEPGELPHQLKFDRPTIERGESREAKRATLTDPTTLAEDED